MRFFDWGNDLWIAQSGKGAITQGGIALVGKGGSRLIKDSLKSSHLAQGS
jgi:hypothetical protein